MHQSRKRARPAQPLSASFPGAVEPEDFRFGHWSADGSWSGKPVEIEEVEAALDGHTVAQAAERPTKGDTSKAIRIKSGVSQLLAVGKIRLPEVAAAGRWARDWAMSQGARDAAQSMRVQVDCSAEVRDGMPVSQIDALTRLRAAQRAVGTHGHQLLEGFVGLGFSLNALAPTLGMSRQDLGGAFAATLLRLTEHYAEADEERDWRRADVRRARAAVWTLKNVDTVLHGGGRHVAH